jgi:hypothetical protein
VSGPYPPAVWWIPKHVRDRLISTQEAARPNPQGPVVEGGEPPIGVCEETDGDPLEPGQLFRPGHELTYEGRRLVDPDRSVVEAYHRQATSGDGGGYWCRVDGCMHRAAAHNGVCPVCADKGFKPVADETGDAA